MRLRVAETPEERALADGLVREYVASWFGGGPITPEVEEEIARERAGYEPPSGCALLAFDRDEAVGVVCLREAEPGVCEMKRMWVRPSHRRRGVARALTLYLLDEAWRMGYQRMKLDTMNAHAVAQYERLGFRTARSGGDPRWWYMERGLATSDEEWHERERELLEIAYLDSGDPRAQSGFWGDETRWEAKRRVVVEAIDRDGTFLDVGCANGYLMESVHRWARERGVAVEPYGVDISTKLVALARERLPAWAHRIWVGNATTWIPPRRFDFVRTLLDAAPPGKADGLVRHLIEHAVAPGGRLIVCWYSDPDARAGVEALRARGFELSGTAEGPEVTERPSPPTVVAWIDA